MLGGLDVAILANKVHKQGMTLLVDKVHVHEQEPQHKWLFHTTIPISIASGGMTNATLFTATYRDGFVNCIAIYIVVLDFLTH